MNRKLPYEQEEPPYRDELTDQIIIHLDDQARTKDSAL